jgi:hypothetical protein
MTGKPRRTSAKRDVHIAIHNDIFKSVQPLLKEQDSGIESFSNLVETIIFLSFHMYTEEPDNGFIARLAKLKTSNALRYIEHRSSDTIHHVHMTLDIEAIAFLDMLVARYGILFESRSAALDLLLCNIGNGCTTPDEIHYYSNRLNEVLRLHPKYKG